MAVSKKLSRSNSRVWGDAGRVWGTAATAQPGRGNMQRARAGLVFWGVITAILAAVTLGAPRVDAMCCSCSGLNCGGGGFCVDGVADGGACGTVCGGCGTVIFATNDV